MVRPVTPVRERFMRHVQVVPDGCWLWTAQRGGKGRRYGYFRVGTRTEDPRTVAHRVSYELFIGPIPEGYEVDHVKSRGCQSTLCVRPDHLEAVPPLENTRRERLAVCRSGRHDLTDPSNMQFDKKGRRRGCRPCALEIARNSAARRYERLKREKTP